MLQKDMSQLAAVDLKYVSIMSMVLIAIILAISFKSIILPVILIMVIQLAIWINLSIPFIMNRPVYYLTSIFIYAIQLGATVDYAILLTMRYRENLKFYKPLEAMQKTIDNVGRSIFTSALILFAGTAGITLMSKIITLWKDSELKFKKTSKNFLNICKILAITEDFNFDKRAKLLQRDHPLAIQVDLKTGVANGVLVVRNIKSCAQLIYNFLINDLSFEFKYNKDNKDQETIELIEKSSKSIYRVIVQYKKLVNAFWNFYLKCYYLFRSLKW